MLDDDVTRWNVTWCHEKAIARGNIEWPDATWRDAKSDDVTRRDATSDEVT